MKKRKIFVPGIVLFALGVITIILAIIFSTQLFSPTSVFNNNPTGNEAIDYIYHKIPALIRAIEIVTVAFALTVAVRWLLSKLFIKNKRATTIVKLFSSFLKYLIAIVAIFLILSAFGVDARTLLASAGILGLIIGLGAQNLIADLIAGVFIVFEGDFEVGDIVVIDGWRGEVSEIGIRTTKIVDWSGNIKIVNNSDLKTVINMTNQLSLAVCDMSIEYGESLERVEAILKENLDQIRENIPEIKDGPYYKGVAEFASSAVVIRFIAKCEEDARYQVERDLNRQFKLLFDKNNINIPFPQVVVNEPTTFDKASKQQKRAADAFVEEQKELSKDIGEGRNDI